MRTNSYTRIWMVAIKRIDRPNSQWGVTGPHWFRTRKECKEYINQEINPDNFACYIYMPWKYLPFGEKP